MFFLLCQYNWQKKLMLNNLSKIVNTASQGTDWVYSVINSRKCLGVFNPLHPNYLHQWLPSTTIPTTNLWGAMKSLYTYGFKITCPTLPVTEYWPWVSDIEILEMSLTWLSLYIWFASSYLTFMYTYNLYVRSIRRGVFSSFFVHYFLPST